jgi:putative inorganic carbon (hco3(-)) transporter
VTRVALRQERGRMLGSSLLLCVGMAAGLALVYWAGAAVLALVGLLLFGLLALARPELGLLFVLLTVPLYLIPPDIKGVRAGSFRPQLQEVALLAVAAATAGNWLVRRFARAARPSLPRRADLVALARSYAPHLLFLIAGFGGVLLAAERSRALIEFRRTIAEPLLFYLLANYHLGRSRRAEAGHEREQPSQAAPFSASFATWLAGAFALSGALVGALALLQYARIDLVPLLGSKQCFAPDGGPCPNIVADGGVRRVLSVYGHPNNLGLYLGRVWPAAAGIASAALLDFLENSGQPSQHKALAPRFLFFAMCVLLGLTGVVVSFSRGAWLGTVAAAAVLVLGWTIDRRRSTIVGYAQSSIVDRPLSRWIIILGVALVILASLALSIRGDVTGGSTPVRLLLWREALNYIALYPLGIGLDQFGFYHDPASPLSLIDPALVGTSEQYAAHPHNLLLDIWLRVGPLGLIAFGWLLWRFFRMTLASPVSPRAGRLVRAGLAAAMVAALVHGLVDNSYFLPDLALAFWLLIALAEY